MKNYIKNRDTYFQTVIYIETNLSSGTGFIISKEGYAITCNHVIERATEIFVRINNNNGNDVVSADVVLSNKEYDYAIIKLESNEYNFAELSIEDHIELGNDIIILGYPFGKKLNDHVMELSLSFTRGYISSVQNQNNVERVLLDISAKSGNSGSPVIDMNTGKVLGVLRGSIINQSTNITEEINYMSPIKYLFELIDE